LPLPQLDDRATAAEDDSRSLRSKLQQLQKERADLARGAQEGEAERRGLEERLAAAEAEREQVADSLAVCEKSLAIQEAAERAVRADCEQVTAPHLWAAHNLNVFGLSY
jgi:septal ring factor EnvC (AmiA/AmiB activator)